MADNKKDNENFQYIVRIANKDIKGERKLDLALSDINGIGERLANILIKKFNLDKNRQIGELSEDEVLEIRKYVENKEYEGDMMGDQKFQRKRYSTPRHPWEKERIGTEREIVTKYGLKNKRELWKADRARSSFLSPFISLFAIRTMY